jgi:hypothetical protein
MAEYEKLSPAFLTYPFCATPFTFGGWAIFQKKPDGLESS